MPATNTYVERPREAEAAQPGEKVTVFQTGKVATVSSAHFVHDIFSSFFAPLLPVIIANMSLTKTAAGLLTVFYNGPSLLQPFIGHLGDRVNLRLLVVLGPSIAAAMMTLLGIAPSYAILALLLLVAGISSAGLHAIGPVIAGTLSGSQLGRGMSFWMVAGELARTLGPLIVVGAVQLLTPRGLPVLMIAGFAASIALYFRLRSVPDYRPAASRPMSWGSALRHMRPILLPLALVIAARSLLFSCLTTFLPTFLTEEGANLWFAGASLSVMEGAGVVGALFGGEISDRLGRRRILAIMTAAAPLAVLLFLNVQGWLKFPVLLLVGLTLLSTTPVLMALVQERGRENRALANGIFMALNFVLFSVGIIAAGALGDFFGLRAAYYTSAAVMLAGLPFVFMLPDK
ncbi:MAG: MFS transporter [Chloroflexi bacterium]|nr:MFS transporter [Chloroflexota bacterium]